MLIELTFEYENDPTKYHLAHLLINFYSISINITYLFNQKF